MTPAVNSRSAADAPPPKMPALSQDAAFPHEALLRLPQLHREVSRNFSEARLLARAPAAALLLMLAGAATLLCAARDESLTIQAGFAWSVLVWAGIALMTRTYIRGFARAALCCGCSGADRLSRISPRGARSCACRFQRAYARSEGSFNVMQRTDPALRSKHPKHAWRQRDCICRVEEISAIVGMSFVVQVPAR